MDGKIVLVLEGDPHIAAVTKIIKSMGMEAVVATTTEAKALTKYGRGYSVATTMESAVKEIRRERGLEAVTSSTYATLPSPVRMWLLDLVPSWLASR